MLALDTGQAFGALAGKAAKDPTFGLDATWIAPGDADAATGAGYLVVDPGTVIATHLNHALGQNAADLLGPDEVQALLDGLKDRAGQLVASLCPQPLPLTTLTQVLRGLLQENIPLKEFRRIAAAVAQAAQKTADADEIVELIRPSLGALIIQKLCGVREPLRVMTLEGSWKGCSARRCALTTAGGTSSSRTSAAASSTRCRDAAQPLVAEGKSFALVVQPAIRVAIRKLVQTCLPDTPVMSFFEVPEAKAVEVVAVIGAPQALRHEHQPCGQAFADAVPVTYSPKPQRGGNALVQQHLPLVRKIAWHVHGSMSTLIEVEDLVQVGLVALVEAAAAFEDRGQVPFRQYAATRVRGAMIDELRRQATTTRGAMRRRKQYQQTIAALTAETGRAPAQERSQQRIGVSVDKLRTDYASAEPVRFDSIDEVYADDQPWFADQTPDAFEQLAEADLRDALIARDRIAARARGAGDPALLRRGVQPGGDRPGAGRRRRAGLPAEEGRPRPAAERAEAGGVAIRLLSETAACGSPPAPAPPHGAPTARMISGWFTSSPPVSAPKAGRISLRLGRDEAAAGDLTPADANAELGMEMAGELRPWFARLRLVTEDQRRRPPPRPPPRRRNGRRHAGRGCR